MPAAENNNKFWNLARNTEGLSLDIQGSFYPVERISSVLDEDLGEG